LTPRASERTLPASSGKDDTMNALLKVAVASLLLAASLAVPAAEKNSGAVRNLAWAALTLEKIEKDLGELAREPKGPEALALAAAFAGAHARLAALQQAAAAADAESLGKATDFAKNLANLAEWTLDRASDLTGKKTALRKLWEEHPVLATTDFGRQLDEVLLKLAGSVLDQAAGQLAGKQAAAGEAEGVWNTQALRFDQLMDEADNEAGWLGRKEELQNAIRESGKQLKLTALEAAREQVRAARHAQQELALEKQKYVNQVAQLNQLIQSLDEKAGALNEAADKAREAFDEAQGKLQEAIDE
jgi:hypothetical protein